MEECFHAIRKYLVWTIFLPVVTQLGMHPLHFGIVMIANLCIGLCTPPVGNCLFIGCSVGKVQMSKVAMPMVPFREITTEVGLSDGTSFSRRYKKEFGRSPREARKQAQWLC